MAIRIANIGDVHFTTSKDWAADKGGILGKTLATNDGTIEKTIVVFNGDLTYSGTMSQFEIATRFLSDIRSAFPEEASENLLFACTPGNHDCNFEGDQSAREQLMAKLKPRRPAESIEKVVLAPLENYFAFVEANSFALSIDKTEPYKAEMTIDTSGGRLDLTLLNSSWMSSIHERPGSLLFPNEFFNRHDEGVTRLAALHHPPNWFKQPETMRELIRWFTENADLCMSGHEHSVDIQFRLNERLRGVIYYEGGVFQEHPTDHSGQFQVMDIDLHSGALTHRKYAWSKDYFALVDEHLTKNFKEATAKATKTRLKSSFIELLDDPNIPGGGTNSPSRLKDFYVYPDAVEFDEDVDASRGNKERMKIAGKKLIDYCLHQKKVLFIGPERCGKTALAKQFVIDLHSQGKLPVLLNAKVLSKAFTEKKTIDRQLRKALSEQYEDVTLEYLSQQCTNEAVAIVDDFEEVFDYKASPLDVSSELDRYFSHITLVASDEFAILESQSDLSDAVGLPTYKRLQILDLGHEKLSELTDRWFSSSEQGAPTELSSKDVAKLISQILSTDFIPHHPWIVIVLLETSAREDGQAMTSGSYGHLYHAILTAAMAAETKSGIDINGKFNYLSYLAYAMYQNESPSLTDSQSRDFHHSYCERLDRDLPYEGLIEGLVDARILKKDERGVSFDARFSFCYFLANYFKIKMDTTEVKNAVKEIVDTLFHRESANILLFLSHLAPGAWPLDLILGRANSLFAEKPLWNLESDMAPVLEKGSDKLQSPALPDGRTSENQAAELTLDDELRRATETPSDFDGREIRMNPTEEDYADCDELIREIRSAYKLIRIIGQVLRNNVDSMEGPEKKRIVDSVFRLSRRMLGDAFSDVGTDYEERRESVLQHLEALQIESGKRGDRQSLIVKADRELIGISFLACFAVTRSVCDAVGAKGLSRTYERVLNEDASFPTRLYVVSLLMDNATSFPEQQLAGLNRDLKSNWFGLQLLHALVTWHFYMYERPIQLRQSVLAKLRIGDPKPLDPSRTRIRPPKNISDRRGGRQR